MDQTIRSLKDAQQQELDMKVRLNDAGIEHVLSRLQVEIDSLKNARAQMQADFARVCHKIGGSLEVRTPKELLKGYLQNLEALQLLAKHSKALGETETEYVALDDLLEKIAPLEALHMRMDELVRRDAKVLEDAKDECDELAAKLEAAKQGVVRVPQKNKDLRDKLTDLGLSVRYLYEFVESVDPDWRVQIETVIGRDRYAIVPTPEDADGALGYVRATPANQIGGVRVINTRL